MSSRSWKTTYSTLCLTIALTFFLYSFMLFLNCSAASMFAGESRFGSPSIDITETRILSTPKIGRHLSSGLSCSLYLSWPGGWSIDMHTCPSGYTFGCHISCSKHIFGGLFGKSSGNVKSALKIPPSYSVSGGPSKHTRHLKKLESSSKPTEKPEVSSLVSSRRRKSYSEQLIAATRQQNPRRLTPLEHLPRNCFFSSSCATFLISPSLSKIKRTQTPQTNS